MGRYQALDAMIASVPGRRLAAHLHGIGDVERILSRVALRSARPRDLRQLCEALSRLPELRRQLADNESPLLIRASTRSVTTGSNITCSTKPLSTARPC